jgi:hypothetical protein
VAGGAVAQVEPAAALEGGGRDLVAAEDLRLVDLGAAGGGEGGEK